MGNSKLFGIGSIQALEDGVVVLQLPVGFVGIHVVLSCINNGQGNVGAVVGGTLQIGQQLLHRFQNIDAVIGDPLKITDYLQ